MTFSGPDDAIAAGIGMVHQHFMLVPVFTVAENVMLGDERGPAPVGFLDRARARARSRARSRRSTDCGSTRTPWSRICRSGVQQRVEIVKALIRDAQVLILDEPTAVLTPQEIDELFAVMRVAARGGQVHRLHHAQAQRGQGDRRPDHGDPPRPGRRHRDSGASETNWPRMMVGRNVQLQVTNDRPVDTAAAPALDGRAA